MAHLTSSSCNRLRPVHSSKLSVFKPCSCTPPQSGSTVCQQARATGSTSSSELSSTRRHIIQKLALAATAATLDSANSLQHPPVSQAALVQFPASDLRNTYYLVTQRQCCSSPQVLLKWLQIEAKAGCSYSSVIQVRAGEGQCEADNYVLTNTVYKTSMNNGLSRQGKRQVARQVDIGQSITCITLFELCVPRQVGYLSRVLQASHYLSSCTVYGTRFCYHDPRSCCPWIPQSIDVHHCIKSVCYPRECCLTDTFLCFINKQCLFQSHAVCA